jgi:hypothetical protein
MTSINPNRDCNTILLDRYEEDYQKDDLQFPLRYLLFDATQTINIFFELPNGVEQAVLMHNLLQYRINRTKDQPRFSNDILKLYLNRERVLDRPGDDAY